MLLWNQPAEGWLPGHRRVTLVHGDTPLLLDDGSKLCENVAKALALSGGDTLRRIPRKAASEGALLSSLNSDKDQK